METANKRGSKSFLVTWLLSLLVGVLGVDRFYLGKVGTGVLKLITIGGVGIWWFVDLIIILCDGMRDKSGNKLADYDKNKLVAIIVTVAVLAFSGIVGANQRGSAPVQTENKDSSVKTETPKKEEPAAAWDVQVAYDKIQTGMTKAEVETATSKPSESCTTMEDPTFGKNEYCSYGNAFIDKATISVTYSQDKVSSKSKSTY